jgi:hypothetical protein
LFLVETEDGYVNWNLDLLARYGDDSPEAPTKAEYQRARVISRSAPPPLRHDTGNGAGHDEQGDGAPPPASIDDYGEVPDWVKA